MAFVDWNFLIQSPFLNIALEGVETWTFEGYLSDRSGQINLFVLQEGRLVALLGRWERSELLEFCQRIGELEADENAWRNWDYLDASTLDGSRFWQLTNDGCKSAQDALTDYYERCKTCDELFFSTSPEGVKL
ncbi:MAG: hypothetical protein IK051_05940 [Rhodocyclaceae bacterium]|nr:hypothetical protein [Rhodocyclaceae bacterium]